MRWNRSLPLLLLFSGCAHLGSTPSESWERARLWDEAHGYFATNEFAAADSVFSVMVEVYPDTNEGRESLFYLGALRLDPRNPEWDPVPAEASLEQYLAAETEEGRIHRRPEGETLFQLAHQLNLPMEERIPDMRVEPNRVVILKAEEAEGTVAENERLRRDLAARTEEVRQLREELERIRKTLTGGQEE
jgi:hypothetical protein